MLQVIMIGRHVSVQGDFVRRLADGRIAVRVGCRIWSGHPIAA